MAVSRVTLIVLVATVAVSLTAAKSIEHESMDYAHKLLMDMTSGGGEPKAVGPASASFGRALFGEEENDDHDRHLGIELFRDDQIFETVMESNLFGEEDGDGDHAEIELFRDEDFVGQKIGNDAHYFNDIMLEKDSDDSEFQ